MQQFQTICMKVIQDYMSLLGYFIFFYLNIVVNISLRLKKNEKVKENYL